MVTFLTSEAPGANAAGDHHRAPGSHEESTPSTPGANSVRDRQHHRSFRTPTARQLEVLRVVHRSIVGRGFQPTLVDLATELGLASTYTVHEHLAALRRKGLLESDPMRARALRVTCAGLRAIGEPTPERRVFMAERRFGGCGIAFYGEGCPGCGKAER